MIADSIFGHAHVCNIIENAYSSKLDDSSIIVVVVVVVVANNRITYDESADIVVDFQKCEIRTLSEVRQAYQSIVAATSQDTISEDRIPGIKEILNREKKTCRGSPASGRATSRRQGPTEGYCVRIHPLNGRWIRNPPQTGHSRHYLREKVFRARRRKA